MKTIEKDELFDNVRQFLKKKGIELTDGSYSQTIQKSCRIVSDVVNMGQQGLKKAKTTIDTKLDQVREAIYRKSSPKPPRTGKAAGPSPAGAGSSASAAEAAPTNTVPPPVFSESEPGETPSAGKPKRSTAAKKKTPPKPGTPKAPKSKK